MTLDLFNVIREVGFGLRLEVFLTNGARVSLWHLLARPSSLGLQTRLDGCTKQR